MDPGPAWGLGQVTMQYPKTSDVKEKVAWAVLKILSALAICDSQTVKKLKGSWILAVRRQSPVGI